MALHAHGTHIFRQNTHKQNKLLFNILVAAKGRNAAASGVDKICPKTFSGVKIRELENNYKQECLYTKPLIYSEI